MAISKSLAQAHSGTLTAQSDGSNRGSTFTLSMQALPQGEAASVASKAVSDSARQALKILLVDDHHDTCAALEKLLARRGYLVAASHDVRSAMDAAVRNKFDLLISNIALPDGTGMDLMMEIARDRQCSQDCDQQLWQ